MCAQAPPLTPECAISDAPYPSVSVPSVGNCTLADGWGRLGPVGAGWGRLGAASPASFTSPASPAAPQLRDIIACQQRLVDLVSTKNTRGQ